jgi:hypothetical protein
MFEGGEVMFLGPQEGQPDPKKLPPPPAIFVKERLTRISIQSAADIMLKWGVKKAERKCCP